MKYFFLFFAFSLTFINCEKEDTACPGLEEGKIIGLDLRLCACCGGWFIEIGTDTLRTFALPDDFKIDPLADFPVEVCLSYEYNAAACDLFGDLIVVNEIVSK